jgi:hypothetical protein
MGKMHLMQLIEINRKTYTKTGGRYYFYKQWHDPDNYKKRIEKTYLVRRHQSKVETPIKTKTTFGEIPDFVEDRHEYLDIAHNNSVSTTKMHSNTSEVGGNLMVQYFGGVHERKPPDDFMKGKDPVDVFFTDKWFKELQKHFPVSPSGNYLGTFLEPYLLTHTEYIRDLVDDLSDVDVLFNPFSLMGKYMLGYPKWEKDDKEDDLELYVLELYKSRKNVVPYKEDLIDCFASKLKRYKKRNVIETYKKDKRVVFKHLDGVVKNLRRIEKYMIHRGIEPVYFNMDRDDYKDVFEFEKNDLPRTATHPGDYPEREQFEQIAKEYVTMRDMRDMRRRNRLRDWI